MRRFGCSAILLLALAAPIQFGCDETVHEEKTVKTKSDGTTVTKEEKTTKSPDGAVSTEKTVEKH